MTRFLISMAFLCWLCCVILLGLTLWISPQLPNQIGIVSFLAIRRETIINYYIDYDVGAMIEIPRAFPQVEESSLPRLIHEINQQTLYVGSDNTPIVTFPPEPRYIFAGWYQFQETVFVIHLNPANQSTTILLVDVAPGKLRHYLTIEHFMAAMIDLSPDGNYLLLRELVSSFSTTSPPQAHRLINLRNSEIYDLGDLTFAYWSPDSKNLLIGQPTEHEYQALVGVYDTETDQTQNLGITVSQEDISFFTPHNYDTINALLWSHDSQSLMIYNRFEQTLHHTSTTGETIHIYQGRHNIPQLLSPDGRYLLVSDESRRSNAYIIDTHAYTVSQVQSDTPIIRASDDVVWSSDSRHLAIMSRTTGIQQSFRLSIYDSQGQQQGETLVFGLNQQHFVFPASLSWFE